MPLCLAQTVPSSEDLHFIGRESLVLLTVVVGLVGLGILIKWAVIPLAIIVRDAITGLAQSAIALKDGIRDNLEMTRLNVEVSKNLHELFKKD